MNTWNNIPPNIEEYVGFVYIIHNKINNMYYIGKKGFWSNRKTKVARKPTKVEMTRLNNYKVKNKLKYVEYKKTLRAKYKGLKKTVRIIKESNWKEYYGSSKWLLEDIEKYGKENFTRTMLFWCKTLTEMSYKELIEQLKHDVLNDKMSYNGIIAVKLNRTR